MSFKKGQKVRCVKKSGLDNEARIAEHLRWHIGDEFIIEKVEVKPWGTFLYDGNGHNLSAWRAEVVE